NSSTVWSEAPVCNHYIGVIVKLPLPVQVVLPVNVHVPVIFPLLTVPCSLSTSDGSLVAVTVMAKVPDTCPLKFPVKPKLPVSVTGCELKQAPEVEKLNLVTVKLVPLPCVNEVVKAKAVVPSVLVSIADQFPLMLPDEFPPPQPDSTAPSMS